MENINGKKWEFDSYSDFHWQEIKDGNVDKTKSWVELSDTEDEDVIGQKVVVYRDRIPVLEIITDRDQWGTYITLKGGGTIAQEDGTKSFIDALIAALAQLKNITDLDTTPPIESEL